MGALVCKRVRRGHQWCRGIHGASRSPSPGAVCDM